MAVDEADDIDQLVQDVVEASKIPAKARAANVKPIVARLTSRAYEQGLLPDVLDQLINLLTTPSHLDQSSLAAIARNLYPATKISADVVVRVVGALGHGKLKPSLNLQGALLKWLILVYPTLDSHSALHKSYSVLFNLLDTAAISPYICHLLALVTRRKHVRPFRIQALLNLSRQTGNNQSIVGLLRVYKDYYPEIIVGEAVRGKASAFKYPDPAWRERLDEIQEVYVQQTEQNSLQARDGFRVNRPMNRLKKNKVVPMVHTSHATENSVTLEEIESASNLVQNLEKIELPNQLVAILADPLLQKLMQLRPDAVAFLRVANWLNSVLQDLDDGDVDETTLWEVLNIVKEFIVQIKFVPPVLLDFFARFFQIWTGTGDRECIAEILAYCPFIDFAELLQHILRPFERATIDNTPEFLRIILTLYNRLLIHWTAIMRTTDPIPLHASASIAGLIRHTGRLAETLLQASPAASTDSAILTFYEQTVRVVNDDALKLYIRIELPPSLVIYTLLFSSSLATVARLCDILACYKKGFETAMSTKARRDGSARIDSLSYDRAYVNRYNGYLMDICNCFWRARAFSDTDTNAHGCLMPRATVSAMSSYITSVDKSFALASLFSLSHSPILCYQSIQRVRELEDAAAEQSDPIRTRHAGPVTQSSLAKLNAAGGLKLTWPEYRIDILRTLGAKGFGGVAELLKNTMTVLKNSMDANPTPKGK